MFQSIKNKLGMGQKKENIIMAPIQGEAVPFKEVNDPTFSGEILGKGLAIRPEKGRVVSPVDGKVTLMVDSKHAISITSDLGTEVLIHIGLETVNLKGKFFKAYVKANDRVKTGDLLLEFEMDKIMEAGYDMISPIVICNTEDYSEIQTSTGMHVNELDEVIKIVK